MCQGPQWLEDFLWQLGQSVSGQSKNSKVSQLVERAQVNRFDVILAEI